MWFHHLANLLRASSDYFFSLIGTTTLGFVAAILDVLTGMAFSLIRIFRKEGKIAMLENLKENAKTTVQTLAVTTFVVYGTLFVYSTLCTVYVDHVKLANKNAVLVKTNAELSTELEARRHEINVTDPVFSNINAMMTAFQIYRRDRNGSPCVLFFTAPPSSASLAGTVAQLSHSDCFTFGPMPLDDPDVERLTLTGMLPNKVIFHAEKGDAAAEKLYGNLSSLIQMKRSYDLPAEKSYALPSNIKNEKLVWLQFGSESKWNSEVFK